MIETALYSVLSGTSGISSLVSTRIYPMAAPQNTALPYITYVRLSTGRRELTHGNPIDAAEAEFQIDCVASSPSGAKTLASAVIAALHGYKGTVGTEKIYYSQVVNESDLLEDEINAYIVAVDVAVLYKE